VSAFDSISPGDVSFAALIVTAGMLTFSSSGGFTSGVSFGSGGFWTGTVIFSLPGNSAFLIGSFC
jgi:hypothetical protein